MSNGFKIDYLKIDNFDFDCFQGVHDTILQALNFTKDVVVGKFQAAKKDNEFVYHEAVPVFENIPEIKGNDNNMNKVLLSHVEYNCTVKCILVWCHQSFVSSSLCHDAIEREIPVYKKIWLTDYQLNYNVLDWRCHW